MDSTEGVIAVMHNCDSCERHDARKPGWIWTWSGIHFWPLDPRPMDVVVQDIAHALSNQCRYSGHVREFYSVAEHCVRVSYACPPDVALQGLLHDAAEAYLTDLTRPVKRYAPLYPVWEAIESRVHRAIMKRYSLEPEMPAAVKAADDILASTEMRDLMNVTRPRLYMERNGAASKPPMLDERIVPWSPEVARRLYLERFRELYDR